MRLITGFWICVLFSVFSVNAQLPVFHTSGRFLLDPCGDTVIIRGVELPVRHLEYIPEVAKTGANFIRILVSISPAGNTIMRDLDSMLALTRRSGMAADVSVYNGTMDGSSYVQADVMAVLKKYEDIITLHALGEGRQDSPAAWAADAKTVITRIRNAGYRCPLYILSTSSGRDPFTVFEKGQEVVNHDPLHNILCGVQLYWGYTAAGLPGWYIRTWEMTDGEAIDSFARCSFPIVAGINNYDGYAGSDYWLDYETQLSKTQANRISWFWWDWKNEWDGDGKYHLSTTGKYGDWGVVAAGAPDLDKFTVSGSGVPTIMYEAESFSSIPYVGWGKHSHSSVSGGQFLCCSGKIIPDWAEWNQVDGGASGGQRTLTITYCNGDNYDNRPLKVILNGDTVGTFTCGYSGPGANDSNFWRVWKDESMTVTLQSGMNTLRLVSTATMGYFNPNYGERTVVSHPASIKNTSVRTPYMISHSCTGTSNINPVSSAIKYESNLFPNGSFELVVTDMAGRILVRSKMIDRNNAAVLLHTLSKGVFLVQWSNADRGASASVIFR